MTANIAPKCVLFGKITVLTTYAGQLAGTLDLFCTDVLPAVYASVRLALSGRHNHNILEWLGAMYHGCVWQVIGWVRGLMIRMRIAGMASAHKWYGADTQLKIGIPREELLLARYKSKDSFHRFLLSSTNRALQKSERLSRFE